VQSYIKSNHSKDKKKVEFKIQNTVWVKANVQDGVIEGLLEILFEDHRRIEGNFHQNIANGKFIYKMSEQDYEEMEYSKNGL